MAYVDGFVIAVPAANKEAYRRAVVEAEPLYREFGATRIVETWDDDVPEGQVTDLRRAVKARPDDVIVFSWIEYPSKAVRDAANEKALQDPRMKEMGDRMPFDGMRMLFGGFAPILDERAQGKVAYVDGSLVPVPAANKGAYRALSSKLAAVLREHGATRVVAAWGDEVPDSRVTDFKGAVKATGDEQVVFSWIEWPSKEARDAGWGKAMADPRMRPDNVPYDERRRTYGGFVPLLNE
ncbi:DUF1428 domain-containing protein [Pyxidicoccus fallax]|uniref:DUF1428 domain-containing protein n=1 Tax=Pyxidicoccus fallax TaxID=394095 RepID=A0A848LRA9_9BACT|nr:DUF1428 domain-containing protein [Pyxidicoccus fallax]NMO20093.1 DUF1428 domain-containing protein [Pyxidicoccus fallax]NPC82567.1 DUF1428 domain-containing protein [Pyxidicoccus fallax]